MNNIQGLINLPHTPNSSQTAEQSAEMQMRLLRLRGQDLDLQICGGLRGMEKCPPIIVAPIV